MLVTSEFFADKLSRHECFRYDCTGLAVGYVLYKCGNGHRYEIYRCTTHMPELLGGICAGTVTIPVCEECTGPLELPRDIAGLPPEALMFLVTEDGLSPAGRSACNGHSGLS